MEYSIEYSMNSMEYSMEYENRHNGIFQKNQSTTLNSIFFEYGIFQEYSKQKVKLLKYAKFWDMEYSMEYSWNIKKNKA